MSSTSLTPTLNENLRQAIAENGGAPLHVFEDRTKVGYVILSADKYEIVRSLFEPGNEAVAEDTYSFVDEVMASDNAHDPLLASYQKDFSPPQV